MSTFPQISEAEFEVMKIVWKYAPINTNEITEKLLPTTNWSPKTIQTLIKRLVTKGALTYEKQSRVFVYTPAVKEDEYIRQQSSSFLNPLLWWQYYSYGIFLYRKWQIIKIGIRYTPNSSFTETGKRRRIICLISWFAFLSATYYFAASSVSFCLWNIF